jgi:hypothetical protein
MIAYRVWYSCYEDHGDLGYFIDRSDAERCLEHSTLKIGAWTEGGDCVQSMGVAEFEIAEPNALSQVKGQEG